MQQSETFSEFLDRLATPELEDQPTHELIPEPPLAFWLVLMYVGAVALAIIIAWHRGL